MKLNCGCTPPSTQAPAVVDLSNGTVFKAEDGKLYLKVAQLNFPQLAYVIDLATGIELNAQTFCYGRNLKVVATYPNAELVCGTPITY